MPLTFIDIERQKNWRIGLFFLLLLAIYFGVIALVAAPFLSFPSNAAFRFWVFAGVTALLVAGIHFFFSAWDAVSAVIRTLNAQPPDPQDDVHKTLANVVEEIHVVTGNKRRITCVVIPSLSMNALAAADLKGEAVIGITEGLLSRLTRPQLEAVIAHEAHHILSGDCLETTVAASLFGMFTSYVENLGGTTRGRAFSSPAFLAWLLLKLGYLLNMFISREREYRADAASVRMTRNPVALAETLHLLSRSWRGAGFIGSGFEMLCIVNPEIAMLDESEGFWADLFSTHPPLAKRIEVLLTMARVSVAELEERCEKRPGTFPGKTPEPRYYALNPQQLWQGPFTMAELGSQLWLSPLTWITTEDKKTVERAWKEPLLDPFFASRLLQPEQAASDHACPACHQPLIREAYEGTQIEQCRFCSGILVESGRIARILARTGLEHPCSDRIGSLARAVVRENQIRRRTLANNRKNAIPLLACPHCGNPMMRAFYSMAHLIEIDRCSFCDLTWFDRDELEMLQFLIVNNIVPDVEARESRARAQESLPG